MSEENKSTDLSEQIVYFFDKVIYQRKIDYNKYRGKIDTIYNREKKRAENVIREKFKHFVYTVKVDGNRNRLKIDVIYPLDYIATVQYIDIIDNYFLILRKSALESRVEYALDNVLVHGQKSVFKDI